MEERKRIIFVVNPISGTSGKRRILKLIESELDRDLFDFDIQETRYMGHAAEIARSAAERGVDVVCAIGGDGTVNEIARSIVHTRTALAIIPAGSGNGLARHLHIPINPSSAIGVINECNVMDMDYGLINGHPFFCTCGMGFDAFISLKFSQAGKRGPITYMENVLKNGLNYDPDTYEVFVDDKRVKEYSAFLISCGNASQYGNNAYIAPEASVRDGLLDVTVIEPFTAIEAPAITVQLFNGKLAGNSRIKTFRCKKLHVHRSRPGAIHYDGDPVEAGTDVDIEIVPGGLRCLSPSTEGVLEIRENIENFFVEHFTGMYRRSELLIQENVRRTQQIGKLNMDVIKKLAKR